MASCQNCGKHVDCDCVLQQGKYCSTCYSSLSIQGKITPVSENTCGQTLENLEFKLKQVQKKYEDKKAKKLYYNAVINSQIKKLETEPCKYYDIITRI